MNLNHSVAGHSIVTQLSCTQQLYSASNTGAGPSSSAGIFTHLAILQDPRGYILYSVMPFLYN